MSTTTALSPARQTGARSGARAGVLAATGATTSASRAGNPAGLTTRELEVLRLVAAGHSNREIADILGLSLRTIERHINNLYAKIGARGKADATAYAFRHGLT